MTEREFLIAELLRFKKEHNKIPRVRDIRELCNYPSEWRYCKEFGSWSDAINEVFYNKEYMINELLRFEEENGRVPSYLEIRHDNGYIPVNRYIEVFGSWANTLKETPFKTRIDEHFFSFEKMDARKWYIVGYIIGDGCVCNNELSIFTKEKDKDNLYDMHQYMKLNTNISIKLREDHQPGYQIGKNCKQWIDDLSLYGVKAGLLFPILAGLLFLTF